MEKVLTHIYHTEKKKENIKDWNISEKEKAKVKQFVEAYETGKITRRTATNTKALIERILSYLKFCLTHIQKDNPTKKEIESFFDNLLKDNYKGWNQKSKKYEGLPYSLKTKKEILEVLVRYYTWKFPKNLDLTEPLKIDIKIKAKEPPYLSLNEIDKLYNACINPEEQYFVSVLFSSGTRAEEFHNIRYSDITMPKGKELFVKVRLRSEFSKTEGRTICLYYKNSLQAVKFYLSQRIKEGMKPEDPVFNRKYNRQGNWLNVIGQRVLGKNINYHLFRHSSATWLASRLNRQQLCIYFGWKFSSNMPDVYIKRSGIDMEEVTNKFEVTEFEEMKIKHEAEIELLGDQMKEIRETLASLVPQQSR